MNRRHRLGAAALVSVVLLAACGSDEEDADPTSAPTTAPAATAAPATTGAPVTEPAATDAPATNAPATTGGSESSAPADDADLDALVAAAREEGELVVYSVLASMAPDTIDAFSQKYGIEIEFTRLASSDLAQRYAAEAESGETYADLIVTSELGFLTEAMANGWITGLSDAGIPGYDTYPEFWKLDEVDSATIAIAANGIAYNTDLVSPEDAPKSYLDLTDPKWEGEILTVNPAETASYVKYWSALIDTYGEEFVEALGANIRQTFPSAVPMTAALGAGEGSVAMLAPFSALKTAISEGAPIEIVPPELEAEGQQNVLFGGEVVVGVSTDAPHPNAARLFAHFLLSEEGASILNSNTTGYLGPAVADHQGALESFVRLPPVVPDERESLVFELLGL